MKGFSNEYGTSDGEVFLARDETSATEIGRGTNTLKNRGEGDERLGIREGEIISASGHGHGASVLDGGGQELDVLLLIVDDEEQVLVVLGGEASVDEVLLAHHADATFIEDILEMLEGKSVLQDV